jgi:dTDP-glucose 4,6-dehydratase
MGAVKLDWQMRLLVTGGAGFIGSALVRHCLRETAYEIINLDNLTYAANLENLDTVLPSARYQFVKADIAHADTLQRIFAAYDPDGVIHLAAESHVDRSIDGPSDFIQTNIVGTFELLNAARRHWENLPSLRKSSFRFLHVSTDEVFGSLGKDGYFTEATPYQPNSPYSASKASSDMLVRAWHHTYGLPVVTTNCSNNYGPYQFPEKLIPTVILNGCEDKPIPVYGKGTNVRDWLHVEDHVRALLTVFKLGKLGDYYNIGGRNEMRNIDLVHLLCDLLDQRQPAGHARRHRELIQFVKDRPGHDQRYAIDASKVERDLGWVPLMTGEEGMRQTVDWYLGNRKWWGNIRARGFSGARIGLEGAPVAGQAAK